VPELSKILPIVQSWRSLCLRVLLIDLDEFQETAVFLCVFLSKLKK